MSKTQYIYFASFNYFFIPGQRTLTGRIESILNSQIISLSDVIELERGIRKSLGSELADNIQVINFQLLRIEII